MNGAATNTEFGIVALAAAQVKAAIDATIELGGQGYTFWGGREGYMSILLLLTIVFLISVLTPPV